MVDSRQSEDGTSIRRRRSCLACQRRFTTFERLEEVPLTVVKRSGDREPFDRAKVISGLEAATKARPVERYQLDDLALAVEESVGLYSIFCVASMRWRLFDSPASTRSSRTSLTSNAN